LSRGLLGLAIIALLLGLASPLPIWPGPSFIRHLPPALLSAVLMITALLRAGGSRNVSIVGMIYGFLALGGCATLLLLFLSVSGEGLFQHPVIVLVIILGITAGIVVGLATVFLALNNLKKRREAT